MPKSVTLPLISAERNLHLAGHALDSRRLAPDCPTPWTVRMDTLHGGKQQGVDLITLDIGPLRLRVCPTRGMSIIDATLGPLRLGWDSPVKEIVHPAFVDLQRRGRTGWLEGFNGLLVRCGLEFLGPPCNDSQHPAVGEPPASDTTLHGKIANTPASEVEVEVQAAAPFAVTLRGAVHERQMYGPKLALTTELTLVPGEPTFTVRDTITNHGGQPAEVGLLYHINQGRPILEDGARLLASVAEHTPRDEGYPEKDIQQFDRFGPPTPASPEQAYFLELDPDPDGRARVLLHNKNKDLGLGLSWQKKQLPHFTLWKALHDERDGYVTGLEPCTTYPLPRPDEREAGRLVKLKPNGRHKAELAFELLADKQAVAKAVETVAGG